MNDIKTWQQGQYAPEGKRPVLREHAEQLERDERHLVRPALRENAICHCPDPKDAAWIAKRLNLASRLEEMSYNFATGKTDGSDIVEFVRKSLDD